MSRHKDISDVFNTLCHYDDKNIRLQTLKYYEEFGEFFREYLVYCSELEQVRSMSHRKVILDDLIEEGFDCMIVLSRLQGKPLPSYVNTSGSNQNQSIDILAYAIKETSLSGIQCSLSSLCKSEEVFYSFLDKKITKWEQILIKNGCMP